MRQFTNKAEDCSRRTGLIVERRAEAFNRDLLNTLVLNRRNLLQATGQIVWNLNRHLLRLATLSQVRPPEKTDGYRNC